MSPDELVAAYRARNSRCQKKFVFHLTGRGFASEIKILLCAMLYCLENGIEFRLYSRGWNGKTRRGWRDYFLPFCREVNSPFFYRKTAMGLTSFERLQQRVHERFMPNLLTTHQLWSEIISFAQTERIYNYPDLGIRGNVFHAMQVLLGMVYRYNACTLAEWAKDDELISLMKPYVGVHARRGDKVAEASKEADRFEARDYLDRVDFKKIGTSKLFLATDDHAVIHEFEDEVPEGVDVVSFCDPNSNGHVQKKFNKQNSREKRESMLQLLRDIRFLVESEEFVGTFSSNVGWLIGLLKSEENCHSVDVEWRGI